MPHLYINALKHYNQITRNRQTTYFTIMISALIATGKGVEIKKIMPITLQKRLSAENGKFLGKILD